MLANECGSLRSLMAICSFAVLMIWGFGAHGTMWAVLEMTQLLNSWEPLFRSSSDDLMLGKQLEAFSNVALSVKLILVACTAFIVATCCPSCHAVGAIFIPMSNSITVLWNPNPTGKASFQIHFHPDETGIALRTTVGLFPM